MAYQIADLAGNFSAYCILRMIQNISGWTTVGVSFLIFSGVSVGRLLALSLHLQYHIIVTVSRVLKITAFLWIGNIQCSCCCLESLDKKLDCDSLGCITTDSQTLAPDKPTTSKSSTEHC